MATGVVREDGLAADHWLWPVFDALNGRHFHGRLERPHRILRVTSASFGAAAVNTKTKGVARRFICMDGVSLDADRQTATDALLHEMVHYSVAGQSAGDSDQAHGPRFVRAADAIGRSLGLLPCDTPEIPPELVQIVASVWPRVQRRIQTGRAIEDHGSALRLHPSQLFASAVRRRRARAS